MSATPPTVPGVPPETATPTCYRHPGRETYVSCTRCERPICPDCMRTASVGFQCPECVSEGGRTTRPARTAYGGAVTADTSRVTLVLIAINVVAFVVQQAYSGFTFRFELIPGPASGLPFFDHPVGVATGEYYRLLTSAFLHAGIIHIGFNMYALFIVGPTVEAALGRLRYLALYLVSALGGAMALYLLAAPGVQALGASGAVFGLFSAFFVLGKRANADIRPIAALIGINLVLSFVLPGVAWQDHIGGLVFGAALAAVYAYTPRGRLRTPLHAAAVAALAVAIAVGVAVRTSMLT